MKYNHIDFNGEWASTKTVEAFIAHEKHHGLSDDELRKVHALILIEHGVKPEAKQAGVSTEKATEHGDNKSVQKPVANTKASGSSNVSNKDNRVGPGVAKPGTDDGGKTEGR